MAKNTSITLGEHFDGFTMIPFGF
ncbi:type II toxin-antitoxin system ParD family antitoxin [Vibrio cholerae]|nr:hypothetical protein [Vibrio cholerae]EIJ0936143.1 type II toxin-antitoxin system ParD family antitoxin [Vibrio cholerae]EKF9136307.1 type II toxin-antitoxin system ParD family antitoxin [Vibrio cholerae]QKU58139.1 hypothetical protein HPY04_15830 [Vibrio cholerae]